MFRTTALKGLRGLWAAKLAGVSVLFFGILAGQSAQAVLLSAADDTWVREDNPGSNRNGDLQMNARTDSDGDDNDVILVRFDLSSVTGSSSSSSLIFTWYRSDSTSSNTLSLWGINDATGDDVDWDETTVTYNDAPGLIPDGMDPAAEVAAAHTDDDIHDLDTANLTQIIADQSYGPQVEGGTYSFSGAALDSYINADTNDTVTFLVTRDTATSNNQARFTTNENTSTATGFLTGAEGFAGPKLNVVPEPAALLLLLLGGCAMFVRRG